MIRDKVRFRGEFANVYRVPGRRPLKVTISDNYIEVMVPRIDTHLMVVAE